VSACRGSGEELPVPQRGKSSYSRVGCMRGTVALDPDSVLGFPCHLILPILHTYISFIKHRYCVTLASGSVGSWNTPLRPSLSLNLFLSHFNANRTVQIVVFKFFNAFAASHAKRERRNAPISSELYNLNR
jgi:hypothetical protein